jgi:hypothetical protein
LTENPDLRVWRLTLRGENVVVSGSLNMKKTVCRIPVLTDEDWRIMGYFDAMWHVLRIEEKIYQDMSAKGLTVRYATINVFILGVLYGLFSLYFLDGEVFRNFPDPSSVLIAKVIVVGTGILVAFLLHLGVAFLFWTFCRAMGGEIRFIPTYFILGVAVVPLWFAVPGLTALHAGWRGFMVYMYIAVTGLYAFSSFYMAAKSTFGYSYKKMFIAMAMMLVFTVSFLALWLG